MIISRKIIEKTDWQCIDGRIIPVTKMTDSHLRNSLNMIRKHMRTNNDQRLWDSRLILEAEIKFRKAAKKTDSKQLSFDFSQTEAIDPSDSSDASKVLTKRLNGLGVIGGFLTKDYDKLMKAVDEIGIKHHGYIRKRSSMVFLGGDDYDDSLESDFGDWGDQD